MERSVTINWGTPGAKPFTAAAGPGPRPITAGLLYPMATPSPAAGLSYNMSISLAGKCGQERRHVTGLGVWRSQVVVRAPIGEYHVAQSGAGSGRG